MTSCIARSDTATCHCEGFSPRQSLGGKALSLGRLLRFARNDIVVFAKTGYAVLNVCDVLIHYQDSAEIISNAF